jgi:putative SOS response-associated peptidase YedK
MCGRYATTRSAGDLSALFESYDETGGAVGPDFNVAPTDPVPLVRLAPEGHRALSVGRWGLVPHWSRSATGAARMINARAETIAEKPAYKHALTRRRCLIPADGFFEWARTGDHRTPMYIRFRDGRLFAFAGIWERWSGGEGDDDLFTCSIVTVEPNRVVAPIHNRMPAILTPEAETTWLSGTREADGLLDLLAPHAPDDMEAHPVSRRVNAPSCDDPLCIEESS